MQIMRALAGRSDRAEILYQMNGLITHELRRQLTVWSIQNVYYRMKEAM